MSKRKNKSINEDETLFSKNSSSFEESIDLSKLRNNGMGSLISGNEYENTTLFSDNTPMTSFTRPFLPDLKNQQLDISALFPNACKDAKFALKHNAKSLKQSEEKRKGNISSQTKALANTNHSDTDDSINTTDNKNSKQINKNPSKINKIAQKSYNFDLTSSESDQSTNKTNPARFVFRKAKTKNITIPDFDNEASKMDPYIDSSRESSFNSTYNNIKCGFKKPQKKNFSCAFEMTMETSSGESSFDITDKNMRCNGFKNPQKRNISCAFEMTMDTKLMTIDEQVELVSDKNSYSECEDENNEQNDRISDNLAANSEERVEDGANVGINGKLNKTREKSIEKQPIAESELVASKNEKENKTMLCPKSMQIDETVGRVKILEPRNKTILCEQSMRIENGSESSVPKNESDLCSKENISKNEIDEKKSKNKTTLCQKSMEIDGTITRKNHIREKNNEHARNTKKRYNKTILAVQSMEIEDTSENNALQEGDMSSTENVENISNVKSGRRIIKENKTTILEKSVKNQCSKENIPINEPNVKKIQNKTTLCQKSMEIDETITRKNIREKIDENARNTKKRNHKTILAEQSMDIEDTSENNALEEGDMSSKENVKNVSNGKSGRRNIKENKRTILAKSMKNQCSKENIPNNEPNVKTSKNKTTLCQKSMEIDETITRKNVRGKTNGNARNTKKLNNKTILAEQSMEIEDTSQNNVLEEGDTSSKEIVKNDKTNTLEKSVKIDAMVSREIGVSETKSSTENYDSESDEQVSKIETSCEVNSQFKNKITSSENSTEIEKEKENIYKNIPQKIVSESHKSKRNANKTMECENTLELTSEETDSKVIEKMPTFKGSGTLQESESNRSKKVKKTGLGGKSKDIDESPTTSSEVSSARGNYVETPTIVENSSPINAAKSRKKSMENEIAPSIYEISSRSTAKLEKNQSKRSSRAAISTKNNEISLKEKSTDASLMKNVEEVRDLTFYATNSFNMEFASPQHSFKTQNLSAMIHCTQPDENLKSSLPISDLDYGMDTEARISLGLSCSLNSNMNNFGYETSTEERNRKSNSESKITENSSVASKIIENLIPTLEKSTEKTEGQDLNPKFKTPDNSSMPLKPNETTIHSKLTLKKSTHETKEQPHSDLDTSRNASIASIHLQSTIKELRGEAEISKDQLNDKNLDLQLSTIHQESAAVENDDIAKNEQEERRMSGRKRRSLEDDYENSNSNNLCDSHKLKKLEKNNGEMVIDGEVNGLDVENLVNSTPPNVREKNDDIENKQRKSSKLVQANCSSIRESNQIRPEYPRTPFNKKLKKSENNFEFPKPKAPTRKSQVTFHSTDVIIPNDSEIIESKSQKKSKVLVEKTINDLSYETSLDISSIPRADHITNPCLIYHSTPNFRVPKQPNVIENELKQDSTVNDVLVPDEKISTISKATKTKSSAKNNKSSVSNVSSLMLTSEGTPVAESIKTKRKTPKSSTKTRKPIEKDGSPAANEDIPADESTMAELLRSNRNSKRKSVTGKTLKSSTKKKSKSASRSSCDSDSENIPDHSTVVARGSSISDLETTEFHSSLTLTQNSSESTLMTEEDVSMDLRQMNSVLPQTRFSKRKLKRDSVFSAEEPTKENPPPKQSFKLPKLYQPAKWLNKDFYQFLESKLKPHYKDDTRRHSEDIAVALFNAYTLVTKHDRFDYVEILKDKLREFKICETNLAFYMFFYRYTPYPFRKKVFPLYHEKTTEPRLDMFKYVDVKPFDPL